MRWVTHYRAMKRLTYLLYLFISCFDALMLPIIFSWLLYWRWKWSQNRYIFNKLIINNCLRNNSSNRSNASNASNARNGSDGSDGSDSSNGSNRWSTSARDESSEWYINYYEMQFISIQYYVWTIGQLKLFSSVPDLPNTVQLVLQRRQTKPDISDQWPLETHSLCSVWTPTTGQMANQTSSHTQDV